MITAHLLGDTIISSSEEAFSLYERSRWGEKRESKIEYAPIEALFLIKERKMSLTEGKKTLSEHSLLQKIKKHDKRIALKLIVFSDLRKKGCVVKTALKFGADFRVYRKGIHPGKDHAEWLLFPVKESESHTWYDFAAKNRVAHAAKKKLLLAIVDDEQDITYYEISWLRP